MDLQNIFYILGIISMTLWILIILGVILVLYRAKSAADSFKSSFRGKLLGLFQEKNVEIAGTLGLTFAHFIIDKLKKKKKK